MNVSRDSLDTPHVCIVCSRVIVHRQRCSSCAIRDSTWSFEYRTYCLLVCGYQSIIEKYR